MKYHHDYVWVLAVSSIVGAANENDLQPCFFNFADGIVGSHLEDQKLLDGLQGCNISVI